jgi:hypothetical protein
MVASSSERFVARWQQREGGQERANYALFLTELCDLIGVPHPDPAGADHERNDYAFERLVTRRKDDGDTLGRIDLYKRHSFVLEAKQSRWRGQKNAIPGQDDLAGESESASRGRRGADRAWDVLMLNAKRQAEDYARALPTDHGWPPFILVCDVGHCIEVYADFSGQGKNYTQFPDRQNFRIYLEDLNDAAIRERLRRIWVEPQTLDPAQVSANVTRAIARRLAQVSKALEKQKHAPEDVAMFLMRCLFTMFAEDVDLLPPKSFKNVLEACEQDPKSFVPVVTQIWEAMDKGGFAHALKVDVRRFNGKFFHERGALPLGRAEIAELRAAASYNWKEVDPSIFGTLLEQALEKKEREKLGAHYTPRAYVERLVIATVIEPLRDDWRDVQVAAEALRGSGDARGAARVVQDFHDRLCRTRVLDPACGTGNFLYVTLELMKRLEGEVLEALANLGGQEALRLSSHSIDPHQFFGLEVNPRAAAIAELVLWIGYLQWHFRTKGGAPDDPILKAFRNIEVRNAVLTWDDAPALAKGRDPYPNPRRPDWPAAEFIVGNPPFIGKGEKLRAALGASQVRALWAANANVNESADFVMIWWDRAAELLAQPGSILRRFGFVTTNSISQVFNRRVTERYLTAESPISVVMAIADHPWTKVTNDAALVRIAMTVAEAGSRPGVLREVVAEQALDTDAPQIEFSERRGVIHADLTIGANVTAALPLLANTGLSSNGMMLAGAGFIVTPAKARALGLGKRAGLHRHIRDYRNGRDLMGRARELKLIDLYGLQPDEIRRKFPEVYQHILSAVKPERDTKRDAGFRTKWWVFGRPRTELRPALAKQSRYIATPETTKHRVFQFLDISILPDHMVVAIASEDAFTLGVLASRIHAKVWMPANAASLGVYIGDVRYSKSRCFDPFPFPAANPIQQHTIRTIAEELDAHRKRVIEDHPHLTLTAIYNVLGKVNGAEPATPTLTAAERRIFDDALVLVLKELHDRLDAAVAAAYGWSADISDDEILARLVALNQARAAEEQRGLVRWLRPDYQIPRFAKDFDTQAAAEDGAQVAVDFRRATAQREAFPSDALAQIASVFAALSNAGGLTDAKELAGQFRNPKIAERRIAAVLTSLSRLGHVTTRDGRHFALRKTA